MNTQEMLILLGLLLLWVGSRLGAKGDRDVAERALERPTR